MPDAIAPTEFREVLARHAGGVTIVATFGEGGPVGMTATAFTAASLSPPLVLVCIGHDASAHEELVRAPAWGVSLLGEGQTAMAHKFARQDVDRFAGTSLRAGVRLRVPLIEGAIAFLECRRHAVHTVGDHSVVVGEVVAGAHSPPVGGRPLIHFGHAFGTFANLPP